MSYDDHRSMRTFIDECLELLGTDATVSQAQLGVAYRAWINEPDLTDADVAQELLAAAEGLGVRFVTRGGSPWVHEC